VPRQGIEPHFEVYKTTVIPIYYRGWCLLVESNNRPTTYQVVALPLS